MTVLTSTGNVTDDSATNWSPSQVPAAGDDLVVNHTITFNNNWQGAGRLGSVTFNNASSRFAFSGTKVIEATNGFTVAVSIGASLCTTSIDVTRDLTLRGKWSLFSSLTTTFRIADGSGGNLWVATIGDDEAAVVVEQLGIGSYRIVNSWTGGSLTIKGRVDGAASSSGVNILSASGGVVTWNSVGMNYAGSGNSNAIQISGSARINFTGSFDSAITASNGGLLAYSSSDTGSTFGQTGDVICQKGASTGNARTAAVISSGSGTIKLGGKVVSKNKAITIFQTAGTVDYSDAEFSVTSDEAFSVEIASGALTLANAKIANSGKVVMLEIVGGSIVTDEGTLITNQSTAAQAACNTTALDGKIITLESDPPTLPAVNQVQAGTTFGYSEAIQTGTGLLIDPAVLAAAVQAAVVPVNVSPMTATVAQRVNGTEIVTYQGDTSAIGPIAITDADDNAVDLSGMTLRIVIESSDGADLGVVENADISVTGVSNNQVTFSPPAGAVAFNSPDDLWSLRNVDDNNRVLARGVWRVVHVALKD